MLNVEIRYEFRCCSVGIHFISFVADVKRCVVFSRAIIIKYRMLDSLNPVGKNNCIGDTFLGNELSNKTLMRQLCVIFVWYFYRSQVGLITNTAFMMYHLYGYKWKLY